VATPAQATHVLARYRYYRTLGMARRGSSAAAGSRGGAWGRTSSTTSEAAMGARGEEPRRGGNPRLSRLAVEAGSGCAVKWGELGRGESGLEWR